MRHGLVMVHVLQLYDKVESELWEKRKREKEIEDLKKRLGLA